MALRDQIMCAAFAGRLVVSKQHRSVCEGEKLLLLGKKFLLTFMYKLLHKKSSVRSSAPAQNNVPKLHSHTLPTMGKALLNAR